MEPGRFVLSPCGCEWFAPDNLDKPMKQAAWCPEHFKEHLKETQKAHPEKTYGAIHVKIPGEALEELARDGAGG